MEEDVDLRLLSLRGQVNTLEVLHIVLDATLGEGEGHHGQLVLLLQHLDH